MSATSWLGVCVVVMGCVSIFKRVEKNGDCKGKWGKGEGDVNRICYYLLLDTSQNLASLYLQGLTNFYEF